MVATGISELVMKLVGHSQMALSDMAGLASLQAWLGQELETRGIDAVIYTRYILSILQQDVFIGDDLDSTAENHFFPPNKREGLRAKPVRAVRKLDKRRAVDVADCDQQKKSAAVECLLSLSEEECGIESLVDELYMKLKEQQALINTTEGSSGGTSQSDTAGSSDSDSSEPTTDPAQRYYAAFPALSAEALPAATTAVPVPPEGGVWAAKVTQGLARSDGSAEVARHTVSPKQLSPLPQTKASEVETGVDWDVGCQYREDSDWSCRRCGRPGERGKRQRPPRCVTCNNGNSHRGRNKDQAPRKPDKYQLTPIKRSENDTKASLSPYEKMPPRNTKAWKDYEYMRPIFIVPKIHSPDLNTSRVRSVRTNQKTESVLDFFFKSRAALTSPLLDQMCYCGAESIWRCTAGCLNWPEMLGLGADSEDQSWYTEPLDMMVKPSPIPSRRLYNRRSVLSSFNNMAFFENLHVFNEAMSDEEAIGLDPLGLSSLLNRTLEDSLQDIEDEESDSDSFNTAEESVAEAAVEEEISFTESQDVYADASSVEPTNDQSDGFSDQDEEESKPASDAESEEAAYPPHIKPLVISLPSDDEETMPQNKSPGPQTPEVGSGWESPESQFNWPLSEPVNTLPTSQSTPNSPSPPTITVESVWDLQPALHSSLINSHLDCLRQNSEAIWGCTSLSPHLEKNSEGLFNAADNDPTWGFSSSSGSNSHTVSHASSQDNLYDGTGEHGLRDEKCLCSQSTGPISGGFGLGSRVWEASSPSPGPIMGHMPTPVSSENEVLDDRPFFYLPLGDDDYENKEEDGQDSPLPIPPLEFNFSDSDDDDEEATTSSPASPSHPASHHQSPTQIDSHPSSPFVQHSYHSHSCSTSRDHLSNSMWNGQIGADGGADPTQSQSREVCENSDRGVMASLTCDTLESHSPMSARGTLSHDILLTTLFPDRSSIWSYCMGSFLSPNPGSDQPLFVSPYADEWPTGEFLGTLPLSPKHQGSDLSHLWDVNAVHRCNFCELGCEELAVGGETQNIQRYLMNLRFEVPGQECTIINSGLCGPLLTSGTWSAGEIKSPLTPIWDHIASPQEDGPHTPTIYDYTPDAAIEDHHNSERVLLWRNFEMKPQFFRQRSTSADHTDDDDVKLSQSRSSGFLPSVNSAFCDRIPPRVTQLPHVQSEPALDRQHTAHGRVYNHGRLVQVRSLYKSDASILHQLGLTCGREDDPQPGVEVLPHTHFLPIKNEFDIGLKAKSDANTLERVPTPTGPVPEVCPVLGRQSTYQLYHHPDDEEGIPNFVPRFQVQKATEKCCQTGEKQPVPTPEVDYSVSSSSTPASTPTSTPTSEHGAETELDVEALSLSDIMSDGQVHERQEYLPPSQDPPKAAEPDKPAVSESGDAQQEALGMFLYDMQDVLELSVEDAERFMSTSDTPPFLPVDEKDEVDYSSDYESMGEQVSIEELGRAGIAELWEGGLDADTTRPSSDTPLLGAEGRVAVGVSGPTHCPVGSYRSIWSWGNDGDLPSLPNNFSSSSMHESNDGFPHPIKWSQGDVDVSLTDTGLADVSVGSIDDGRADFSGASAIFTLDPRWADDSEDVFIDDPDVQMQLAGVDPNPEPDQVIFSSDLEQHWLNTRSSFTVQVPNPGQRHSGQRKPCSFFMEGNCRRTDCKFAHDISNITCRFWEESNCFKGVTCPFLHGYPRAESSGSQRSSSERDFNLEQDEFPELPSQQSEDQTAAREPNPIPRRRNGMKKLDDRVRVTANGDVERRRRRYKVGLSVPSYTTKHTATKSAPKDSQDKKDDSMLSTDV